MESIGNVRTRFAPSPTGYMHLGGMRTALFNWLFARRHGGTFILRIDDTDRERNVDAALAPILQAFRWLGLDWDEGPEVGGEFAPYFQSQRNDIYAAAVERLLAEGKAYRCYDTPEQIQADREAAKAAGTQYLNIRRSYDASEAERQEWEASGRSSVVRLLVPRDEKIVIEDAVRGRVEWDCGLLSDPVIMRADGSTLYNLATVVDDGAMRITHVIRSEEHLSNTPAQALLHLALGQELPVFAHIPYVAAPGSTKKLSKRDVGKYRNNPQFRKLFDKGDAVFARLGLTEDVGLNPVMVAYYEQIGYLPAGLLNALGRLGWSLDDKTEFLSLAEFVDNFSLDRVVKAAASFDPDKLNSYQQHWIQQLSPEERTGMVLPFLVAARLIDDADDPAVRDKVGRVVAACGDRLTIFSDIMEFDEFFVDDDELAYDEAALRKRVHPPEALELLTEFRAILAAQNAFDAASLDRVLHEFVATKQIKMGQIIHALRVAVTGKATGVGMFDALELLGKSSCLRRIDDVLEERHYK